MVSLERTTLHNVRLASKHKTCLKVVRVSDGNVHAVPCPSDFTNLFLVLVILRTTEPNTRVVSNMFIRHVSRESHCDFQIEFFTIHCETKLDKLQDNQERVVESGNNWTDRKKTRLEGNSLFPG